MSRILICCRGSPLKRPAIRKRKLFQVLIWQQKHTLAEVLTLVDSSVNIYNFSDIVS